jgi:hypothetical protein
MQPPIEFLFDPATPPDRPPALRRAYDQYMWLARLQLQFEIEERVNDPDNPDPPKWYRVNEVDPDHFREALAQWDAGRAEFLRRVEQAGENREEAMHLDREMRAVLRAANLVAQGLLITGYVEELPLEVFSEWRDVLILVDQFEDQVALRLAMRQLSQGPLTPAAQVGEPRPPVTADVRDPGEPERPPLMRKAADLLVALLSLDAISPSKQRTRSRVVAAVHRRHEVQDYVRAFRQLLKLRYYESATGPEGGVWLTQAGQQRARELSAEEAQRQR